MGVLEVAIFSRIHNVDVKTYVPVETGNGASFRMYANAQSGNTAQRIKHLLFDGVNYYDELVPKQVFMQPGEHEMTEQQATETEKQPNNDATESQGSTESKDQADNAMEANDERDNDTQQCAVHEGAAQPQVQTKKRGRSQETQEDEEELKETPTKQSKKEWEPGRIEGVFRIKITRLKDREKKARKAMHEQRRNQLEKLQHQFARQVVEQVRKRMDASRKRVEEEEESQREFIMDNRREEVLQLTDQMAEQYTQAKEKEETTRKWRKENSTQL